MASPPRGSDVGGYVAVFDRTLAAVIRTADTATIEKTSMGSAPGHIAELAVQLRKNALELDALRKTLCARLAPDDPEGRDLVSRALVAAFDLGSVTAVLAGERSGVFAGANKHLAALPG